MLLLLFKCKFHQLKIHTWCHWCKVKWMCPSSEYWFARNYRWDLGVSHHTTVRPSGCTYLHSAHSWHRLHVYLRVRTHCIVDTRWQKPGIVPPMVNLQLETSVKCDLSQQCFAPSAEQKDIYWAAHNSALIRDHQLYPQPCACVINVVSLTADGLCDFISAFLLSHVLYFILLEFQESTISTLGSFFSPCYISLPHVWC